MLNKVPVAINFTKGLDTKTDPFQLQVGNFLGLTNSVFTTTGRLTKRYGYEELTTLPNASQTTLTTLNDNLIATGSSLYSYSADTNSWINKGLIQPIQLSTQPLIRVSTSQTSPDTAVAPNGLVCLVYIDATSGPCYQISDSSTGAQIVSKTTLPANTFCPRVFVLGNYFIITFIWNVVTSKIQFIAIPLANPQSPGSVVDFKTDVNAFTSGYDGAVLNVNNSSTLYISYEATGTTVKTAYLTSNLLISASASLASSSANLMSVTIDTTNNLIFVTFWVSASSSIFSAAYTYNLGLAMSKTTVATIVPSIAEITSTAAAGVATVIWEDLGAYTYDNSILIHRLNSQTVTIGTFGSGGTLGGAVKRINNCVGLASKAFRTTNGSIYILTAYQSTNQSTYFLMDLAGNAYMRLAYSNGGGYAASQVLPSVSYYNGKYNIAYLNNDFLASVNKGTSTSNSLPVNAIYTQTGVNLATFSINSTRYSSEIAGALHLTGGQLWEYDNVRPVEHGFHLWPDYVEVASNQTAGSLVAGVTYFWQFTYEWTDNQGNLHRSAPSIPVSYTPAVPPPNFTGVVTSGSPTVSSVSSFTGLQVGQKISGTDIAGGAFITALTPGSNQLTMSANATGGSSTTVTITPVAITDVTLNVPTLRITYKNYPQTAASNVTPNNPVRIVGYRWSSSQQVYYQFTSLTSPTLSSVFINSVSFTDGAADASILGNTILYTTGGVIEDIAAPPSIASALFNNRLWLIDAEDQNLLWFSKQVIENTPVEMSDLLTFYVAPTTGVQGSTGPMRALASMDDKLIIFKKDAIYYINGIGPDNTGANNGYSDPVFITSSVGCSNPNSIVLIPNGLMFQSDKGIWLLDRSLNTTYVGAAVETYNSSIVLSANAIPATTQVRFVIGNSITLMYDYLFNEWATHTNVNAIYSTLYQGLSTYLNDYGQVYQEAIGTYVDGSSPVLMSLTTSWINIAGLQGFERFYFANLLGTYITPFKLDVSLSYNYNASASQSIIVTPDNYTLPWGGEASWGSGNSWGSSQDASPGGQSNVFSARLFPNIQKCQSFQVSIQELYDPSYGTSPGQGLTLSGMALIVGSKKGYRTQNANKSFGS